MNNELMHEALQEEIRGMKNIIVEADYEVALLKKAGIAFIFLLIFGCIFG